MEEDVGLEALPVAVAIGLLDEALNLVIDALGGPVGQTTNKAIYMG